MLKTEAAQVINQCLLSYPAHRLNKKYRAQEILSNNPASKLLQAFDLRFQCMKSVAAAKFPINKPIEDAAQIERVIESIRALAQQKGIVNLDAIERLFRHNIRLAERIQTPYFHTIWRKSYDTKINSQRLLDDAYQKLEAIAKQLDLPITTQAAQSERTSADVLALARDVIKYISEQIMDALIEAAHIPPALLQKELFDAFESMLAVYMTPHFAAISKENVQLMVEDITHCSASCLPR